MTTCCKAGARNLPIPSSHHLGLPPLSAWEAGVVRTFRETEGAPQQVTNSELQPQLRSVHFLVPLPHSKKTGGGGVTEKDHHWSLFPSDSFVLFIDLKLKKKKKDEPLIFTHVVLFGTRRVGWRIVRQTLGDALHHEAGMHCILQTARTVGSPLHPPTHSPNPHCLLAFCFRPWSVFLSSSLGHTLLTTNWGEGGGVTDVSFHPVCVRVCGLHSVVTAFNTWRWFKSIWGHCWGRRWFYFGVFHVFGVGF